MSFIVVYITHSDLEAAEAVVNHLLEKRLIACANFFPIRTAYWWEDKIERGNEVVTIVKTTEENWEALQEEVEAIHPYEIPCITKFAAEANPAFEDWVQGEVA